jgi:hypothetical protein
VGPRDCEKSKLKRRRRWESERRRSSLLVHPAARRFVYMRGGNDLFSIARPPSRSSIILCLLSARVCAKGKRTPDLMLVSYKTNKSGDVSERASEREYKRTRRFPDERIRSPVEFCKCFLLPHLYSLPERPGRSLIWKRHHAPLALYKFNLSQVQICPLLLESAKTAQSGQ